MRTILSTSVSVALCAVSIAVAAGLSCAAASSEDKAAEVLAAVRKAIGERRLESLQTFSLKAYTARNTGQEQQMTSQIELYLALPDRYLVVENMTAPYVTTNAFGFNGDKLIRSSPGPTAVAGFSNPFPGAGDRRTSGMVGPGRGGGSTSGRAPTPEEQAMMAASQLRAQRIEASRHLLVWFGMTHPSIKATYAYAGEAESPDGKAHVIRVAADGGFQASLFIDQETHLPLMLTWTRPERVQKADGTQGEPAQTEHRLFVSDWKEVDGLKFPYVLRRARQGTTTEEWAVGSVKVNPKFDAARFESK